MLKERPFEICAKMDFQNLNLQKRNFKIIKTFKYLQTNGSTTRTAMAWIGALLFAILISTVGAVLHLYRK